LNRTANKHLDSCTPFRDSTPTQQKTLEKVMNPNTPNLRLRLSSNNGGFNLPMQTPNEDFLNKTVNTTP
jgi:hypothetical protein